MSVKIITSRTDEEALMAVASASCPGADMPAGASGSRTRNDRFRTPTDALHFLQAARAYTARAHGADFELPRRAPSPAQLERLRQIRDAVQALIDRDRRAYERLTRALLDRYAFHLVPEGGLRPVGDGWDRFIAQRLPAVVAMAAQTDRLRRCANPACGWAVWDATKSNTRVWCDSRTCGNRMKVRAFRARKRREGRTRRA
ncbi:MAG TPA: CGNR zinc finger domain-containing protein [Candidatus Limnocylindria bacterium]|nr:CGNR zinc finger domain-containing protein [Candidatus Limnocylindria bacterium]